jgi:hypothetical protein
MGKETDQQEVKMDKMLHSRLSQRDMIKSNKNTIFAPRTGSLCLHTHAEII